MWAGVRAYPFTKGLLYALRAKEVLLPNRDTCAIYSIPYWILTAVQILILSGSLGLLKVPLLSCIVSGFSRH